MPRMDTRRNALLLFSKVPQPGKVKTRLTPLKDGLFSPEDASYLYHCMLFDVAENCCDALADLEHASAKEAQGLQAHSAKVHDEYTLIISSPGAGQEAAMRALFEESGEWPREIVFMHDDGASFDAHYNDAFAKVWAMGFDTVLSMGCDMPALRRSIITEGFERLHDLCEVPGGGVVLAPDQELGVSVVGWTRGTAIDHTGVFYNPDGLTVLVAYVRKCKKLGLPVLYLPDVPDVDSMADLDHNVTLIETLMYSVRFQDDLTAPWRTSEALHEIGYTDVRIMPNNLRDDRYDIDT